MIDILINVGAALLGGLIGGAAGYFIGKALVKYWEKAKNWFDQVWNGITRVTRAVGILIRQGNRLFKRFVTLLKDGEIEEYYDMSDEGVEIKWEELTDEAKKALQEDEYIPVACYE